MKKHRILIIEDDRNIARLETDYLMIEGYDSVNASTGPEGLKLAETGGFDLIILDLMLPGMDGFELCQTVRKQLDIPVLVVSARIEDIDKIRALGLGADDYMTKPFSPAELVARVKAHLSRYERLVGKNNEPEEISTRGLVINARSHRIFRDGKELSLTSKEFELLFFLASNPDVVFSREQIFEKIWGADNYGDLGTVAVHIQKIRKKIEVDPGDPHHIETVWGTGYRFNCK